MHKTSSNNDDSKRNNILCAACKLSLRDGFGLCPQLLDALLCLCLLALLILEVRRILCEGTTYSST